MDYVVDVMLSFHCSSPFQKVGTVLKRYDMVILYPRVQWVGATHVQANTQYGSVKLNFTLELDWLQVVAQPQCSSPNRLFFGRVIKHLILKDETYDYKYILPKQVDFIKYVFTCSL